ncbi:MAG: hypothetical protein WAW71_04925 [Propioniciclava sp.]|jgi:hypothetical protein
MDLLPLITAGASAVFLATCAALAWRSSPALRSAHRRRWVIIGGFVALVAPYLAFSASRWDPDVADFYASVWFVPGLILTPLLCSLCLACLRGAPLDAVGELR